MPVQDKSKKNLKLFGKDKVATPEEIIKRTETKKDKGKFRKIAIEKLENSENEVKQSNIKEFLDKSGNVLKSSDPISKVYTIVVIQSTYETIVDKMISQAKEGDKYAREQLISLVQGYREAEVESHDAMKEFFDKIIVGYEQPPIDITPYEELGRTID